MKKWGSLIFTLIILALLVYVLWNINFYDVYLLIAKANLFWFFLAVVTMFLSFLVWNIRWKHIFKPLFKGDFWFLFRVLLAGSFFSTVTPGAGIGGEPFRAHYLAKKYKKTRGRVFSYVAGDTFFKLIVNAFFIILSIFFVLLFVQISSTVKLILELVLVGVLGLAALSLFLVLRKSNFKLGVLFKKLHFLWFIKKRFKSEKDFSNFLNTKFRWFLIVLRKIVKNKSNLLVGFALSFVFWILHYFVAYFLFLSFGFEVNILSIIIVITLAEIIGSASIVPGGMGVVESSMILLYSAMGIPLSLAFLVAFLFRIINYFFTLLIGGWCLVKVRRIVNGGKFSLF
jgi:hypothetical protein